MKRISDKKREENKEKAEQTQKMFALFLSIWDETEDEWGYCYCFETGLALHRNNYRENSSCYHHILEKEMFPQYRMKKTNIVIIHPASHNQVHYNIDKTPRIKNKREKVLSLHENNRL